MRVKSILRNMIPIRWHLPLRYYYHRWLGDAEEAMLHLPELITRKGRSIDIGANIGIYTYALSILSNHVEAFEPQKYCLNTIRSYSSDKITTHEVALGASPDKLMLNLTMKDGLPDHSLATLRPIVEQGESYPVPVMMLDQYEFEDVSFIKIDVEGFESEVIKGGTETILREKPVLLVEIEQRHLGQTPISKVFELIARLGYRGYFYRRGKLISLDEFSLSEDQLNHIDNVHSRNYINNFVFFPVVAG